MPGDMNNRQQQTNIFSGPNRTYSIATAVILSIILIRLFLLSLSPNPPTFPLNLHFSYFSNTHTPPTDTLRSLYLPNYLFTYCENLVHSYLPAIAVLSAWDVCVESVTVIGAKSEMGRPSSNHNLVGWGHFRTNTLVKGMNLSLPSLGGLNRNVSWLSLTNTLVKGMNPSFPLLEVK